MKDKTPMKEVSIQRVKHPFSERGINYGAFDHKGNPLHMQATDVEGLKRNISIIRPVKRFTIKKEDNMETI
jgi:hypothetical protein